MSTLMRNNVPLVAVTTVVTILVASQIKPIARPVQTLLSRIYLTCCVLTEKTRRTFWTEQESSNSDTVVTALYIHPVKSLRAVPCDEAVIDAKGFVGDRRFMLVVPAPVPLWGSFGPNDATHRFVTQRQCPSLARVTVSKGDGNSLCFSSEILPKITCIVAADPDPNAPIYQSTLWGDIVTVQDMGDEATAYLQNIVAADTNMADELKAGNMRLVVQHVNDGRTASDKFVPAAARTWKETTRVFIWGMGFLSSLKELNRRLQEKGKDPIPMSRFRPNIVIQGNTPFVEDRMKVIQIGTDTVLHLVAGCPRCKQSCTDQITGAVTEEPVATLHDFRQRTDEMGNVYFAVNAIPAPGSAGKTIRVGDPVKVLQWGEPVWGEG